VEVARLEPGRRLVGAVVEDDGRAYADAAIAIDGGDIRAGDPIVGIALVEGRHSHRPDPIFHQFTDGIMDHRADDAGLEAEAVRQVGGDVELSAADMDTALGRFAERDDSWVQAVDKRAQRHQVQRAGRRYSQSILHTLLLY